MQQTERAMRQVKVTVETDMEARMRCLLSSLLILVAAVALLVTGCYNVARVPEERTPGDKDSSSYLEDIATVVVTAERPDWLMPEVVASAKPMPEFVAHASWAPAAPSALPSSDSVD